MTIFRPKSRGAAGQGVLAMPELARAAAFYQAGRYAEAEAEARTVAAARNWPPEDAPMALGLAALAVNAQGRHADALAAYDDLVPRFRKIFGARHAQTLILRSNRAQVLTALSRHAEAEAECADIARAAARGKGPEMPNITVAARNGQVYALNSQGRHAEAEAVVRAALAVPGVPAQFTLSLTLGLARSLNGQGRHAEGLVEAERAAAQYADQAAQRSIAGAVELATANALLGLDRATEARAQASAGHEACLAAFGPDHYRTVEARELLARIDEA
ncbi:tetratricopeptide repeat protein [Streptomyces sp. NPDC021224]|uniref:tetratricopeptide repeat protein n=1 Tax=unclassified Streptomyces TaxID=2593676 RepID=UPI003793832F